MKERDVDKSEKTKQAVNVMKPNQHRIREDKRADVESTEEKQHSQHITHTQDRMNRSYDEKITEQDERRRIK